MGPYSAPDLGGHRSTNAGRTDSARPAGAAAPHVHRQSSTRTHTGSDPGIDPATDARGRAAHPVTVLRIAPGAGEEPVPGERSAERSVDRHPSGIGRRLDTYLGSVVEALREQGVVTGAPQSTDVALLLVGTIGLDCAAVRTAAGHPTGGPGPERPSPVIAEWQEGEGWCVGFDDDPVRPTRRFLGTGLLPHARAVADFVVGLALGRILGTDLPVGTTGSERPHLRLVR